MSAMVEPNTTAVKFCKDGNTRNAHSCSARMRTSKTKGGHPRNRCLKQDSKLRGDKHDWKMCFGKSCGNGNHDSTTKREEIAQSHGHSPPAVGRDRLLINSYMKRHVRSTPINNER